MNQTVEKERLRRRKQNQRRARTKRFFMVLGVLVVALAAFLITVKICKPDFDFSLLVPDKAVTFVQENVLGHTTTAPTTQVPTAPPDRAGYAALLRAHDPYHYLVVDHQCV